MGFVKNISIGGTTANIVDYRVPETTVSDANKLLQIASSGEFALVQNTPAVVGISYDTATNNLTLGTQSGAPTIKLATLSPTSTATPAQIDAAVTAVSESGIDKAHLQTLQAVTATSAELNKLAGNAVTAADLTKLSEVTATSAQLNYLNNADLTAADIQKLADLNATATEINQLNGAGAVKADFEKLHGITATAAQLNYLNNADLTATDIQKLADLTASATEINQLTGSGVTTADLTKLHGITADAAELNILDGVTGVSANDINVLAGAYGKVTASDLEKLGDVTATAAEINKLAGNAVTAADLTKLSQVTATAAQLNYLNNADLTAADIQKLADLTATATELNYMSGVTSNVQTQLNSKADKVTSATNGNFAGLDANGNLTDSGKKATDFEAADATILKKANVVDNLTSTDTDLPLSAKQGKELNDKITSLPHAMVFKGTLGTGGTITALPTAATTTIGHVYKVIEDGTYAGQAAKAGDIFVCNDTPAWVLIPSGDEPSGTVTNVATGTGLSGGPITTTGTISLVAMTGATATAAGTLGGVPAPAIGENTKFLKGDATWAALTASDIPSLDASKITTGTFPDSILNNMDLSKIGTSGSTTIDGSKIAAGTIGTSQLAANAVTAAKIATGAVGADALDTTVIDGTVSTTNKITTASAVNAVTGTPDSGKTLQGEIDDVEASIGTVPTGKTVQGQIDTLNGADTVTGSVANTVKTAIEGLDVSTITGFGTDKTLATLSETDGKIAATFQSIQDMTGADGTNVGAHGFVPAPAAADNTKFLKGDGTWATVDALPAQSGQSGKFLTTDGSAASWADVDALPAQSSTTKNKFLMSKETATAGTYEASWEEVASIEITRGTTTVTSASNEVAIPSIGLTNANSLAVYQNGLLLTPTTNYTVAADLSKITLVSYTAAVGDVFEFVARVDVGAGTYIVDPTTKSANQYLQYNGSAWVAANVEALPTQTGMSGKFLTTNGTAASWATVDALPAQSGMSGKFLTTNGTAASWDSLKFSGIGTNHLVMIDASGNVIDTNYKISAAAASETLAQLTDTTYGPASTTAAGLMSTADKIKLDGMGIGGGYKVVSAPTATTLEWNKEYRLGSVSALAFTFPTPDNTQTQEIRFTLTSTAAITPAITLPSGYSLLGGSDVSIASGKTYELSYAVLSDTQIAVACKEWA